MITKVRSYLLLLLTSFYEVRVNSRGKTHLLIILSEATKERITSLHQQEAVMKHTLPNLENQKNLWASISRINAHWHNSGSAPHRLTAVEKPRTLTFLSPPGLG